MRTARDQTLVRAAQMSTSMMPAVLVGLEAALKRSPQKDTAAAHFGHPRAPREERPVIPASAQEA